MRPSLTHDTPPPVRMSTDEQSRWRPVAWMPLILLVVSGAAYGLFLVLPYYVNDLDRLPLEEVASGPHDATELWPYRGGGVLSVIWSLGSVFAVMVAPLLTLGAPLWAATVMWRDRRTLHTREWVALVMAVVIGAALIAELATPFHGALVDWWFD